MDNSSWLSLALIFIMGAVSPGPSLVVIINITRQSGKLSGIFGSLGHGIGIFIYAFAAATGIAILAQVSSTLFMFIQFMGALFLFWHAGKLIISKADAVDHKTNIKTENLSRSFSDGLLVAVLNPKVAIFFASIFSAFINSSQSYKLHLEIASLAGIIDTIVYFTYVFLLSTSIILRILNRSKRVLDILLASVFFILASTIVFEVYQEISLS